MDFLNKLRLKTKAALDACRDVVVQAAVRTGAKMHIFTEVNDINSESSNGKKKDKQQIGFPSMQRTKKIHKWVYS